MTGNLALESLPYDFPLSLADGQLVACSHVLGLVSAILCFG